MEWNGIDYYRIARPSIGLQEEQDRTAMRSELVKHYVTGTAGKYTYLEVLIKFYLNSCLETAGCVEILMSQI